MRPCGPLVKMTCCFHRLKTRQLRSWRRFALDGSLLRWYKFRACRDLDGRVRVSLSWEFDYESPALAARRFDLLRLGYRNWRIRCEAGRDFVNTLPLAPCSLHEVQAAVWQKEGFNVKAWDCSINFHPLGPLGAATSLLGAATSLVNRAGSSKKVSLRGNCKPMGVFHSTKGIPTRYFCRRDVSVL